MNKINGNKPGYKHTEVGWIPEDWKVERISKAFKICNHLRYPISEEERKKITGTYPYYGPTKVQDYINHYKVDGKYALIGEDGDHFLKWKELPMTLLVEGKFNVNNHAHLIQGDNSNLTEWFYFYFNHRELTSYLTRQGAGRYKLTKDSLSRIPIPLPPSNEQKKITTILSVAEKAIKETSSLIQLYKRRKKALMQRLLTGKKRLSGFEGNWKKFNAGEIFKSISTKGNMNEQLLSATQDKGMIPRSMLDARVTMPKGDTGSFKLVEIGDFVISLRSFQGGLEYSNYRGIVSPAYTVLKAKKPIEDEFYKQYFKSYDFIGRLAVAVIGIRDGKQVSYEDFCTIKIPYLEIEEQKAIARILKTADKEIQLLQKKLNALKMQKKGLMQQLLTGQKRVKA